MKRFNKRRFLLIPVLLILPFILFYGTLFVLVGLSTLHNNITVQNFARPFLEYPLPPQTVEISNKTWWGVPSAGNVCGFSATRILQTELSEAEIRAYYHDVGFPAIVPERSVYLGVSHLDGLLSVGVSFNEPRQGLVSVGIGDGVYSGTLWDFACS